MKNVYPSDVSLGKYSAHSSDGSGTRKPENPTRGFFTNPNPTRTRKFFYKPEKPENPRFYILEDPKKSRKKTWKPDPNPKFFSKPEPDI